MENDEILNNNLMFKLLNREKYIKELLQIIKIQQGDIETNVLVKSLRQEIGKLASYIEELEDEKLNTLNCEIEAKFKELNHNFKNIKQENIHLRKTNSELIEKILFPKNLESNKI